jgi:aminoglycoside phosphotransferase (APT) family kinase protein
MPPARAFGNVLHRAHDRNDAPMTDAAAGTRAGPDFDTSRLEGWLEAHVAGFRGPVEVRRFSGGQSNPTYLLETPAARYVLRKKPPGTLLPSAHAVDREYRVIGALGREGSAPVPAALALCTDDSVIGTMFYVMSCVDGRVFWDPRLPEVPRAARRAYAEAAVDALARVHAVDWRAAGLEDFGKPAQYLERQISRWGKQYAADEAAGRVPAMEKLIDWLGANVPPGDDASVVHGDYRLDNVMFDPSGPRVRAILDWELATLGHPLADFTYYLMVYRLPTLAFPGLLGVDLEAEGLPGEAEVVETYCRRTGRDGIPALDYYMAFAMFRLAAIFHGIRGRVLRGTAASEKAREYARHVETLADLGWAQAERAMRAGH